MAFQGSLKELPLPDIIQLVSVSGKTGKFTLARDDERGFIYLKNGQMVHAEIADLIGEEAIYALAIWNHGDFQFAAGVEADQQTITRSNTNLLMEAARRLDEWRVLSKKISSIDLVPELQVRQNRHEQITLNPQEWVLVTRIDGNRSIAEIGNAASMSAFEVSKILYGMITAELVVLKPKSETSKIGDATGSESGSGDEKGQLILLADQIRAVADEFLGESAAKTVEKLHNLTLDGIDKGQGRAAIRAMASELEKATSLLRGLTVTEFLKTRLKEIVG